MGKVIKGVAIVGVAIGLAYVTGGLSFVAAGTAGASTVAGVTFTTTALGGAILAAGVSTALATISSGLFAPKIPGSQISRLNVTLDPSTPRKAVFGTTAMNTDLRYHETSGTDQEYVDYIIATSAHKVAAISEIWFDDKRAWTLAGGVQATYSGYLTVNVRTEGTSANYISINGGSKWGSSRRLTGCSYVHLRIKRTGTTSKVESPLVNGLPSRVTIIGEGALLYDPRKDSTVTGGSGSHRANNQTTWGSYTNADDCDNPALQLLWWLLGWQINGKLSIGCGVPASRIDLPSFITAANICDENVTLAIGGTQKRYRTSGTASDADNRIDIINTFLTSMNGTLRDNEGKLTLTVMKNDLADYVLSFDEGDVLNDFEWNQTRGLNESYNIARGRYVDPSNNSLYQLVEYPEVGLASIDGIERVMTVDLPYVEDGRRAQRIAKQVLERNQYRGMFSATFTAKALGCDVGDVVRLSFSALGWTNKLFRVVSKEVRMDGQVPLALVEENAAIYAWDADDASPLTPTAPTVYNPLNDPFILGVNEADGAKSIVVNLYKRTATSSTPSVTTTGTATYTFSTNSISGQPSGWTIGIPTSGDDYLWVIQAVASAASAIDTDDIANTEWSSPVIFAQDGATGATGADGTPAVSGYITNEAIQLFAYADGTVVSYAPATGSFKLFSGTTDISSSFTLSVPTGGNPQSLTYSLVSRTYTITAGFDANEDNATLTIRATGSGSYSGVTVDKVVSLSKAKGGYEIVSTLPSTNLFQGRIVFLTTDGKLYRYTSSAWSKAVDGADITANSILTNSIGAGQVTAAKINVTNLSAINANLGTVTAGVAQSSSGSTVIDLNNARITFTASGTMKVTGIGFGSSSQFLEWYGPTQASLSTCTESNAVYYLKTDGSAYWGGAVAGGGSSVKFIEFAYVTNNTYDYGPSWILIPEDTTVVLQGELMATNENMTGSTLNINFYAKWQYSANGSTWSDVSGATGSVGILATAGNTVTEALTTDGTKTGLTVGQPAYFRLASYTSNVSYGTASGRALMIS